MLRLQEEHQYDDQDPQITLEEVDVAWIVMKVEAAHLCVQTSMDVPCAFVTIIDQSDLLHHHHPAAVIAVERSTCHAAETPTILATDVEAGRAHPMAIWSLLATANEAPVLEPARQWKTQASQSHAAIPEMSQTSNLSSRSN
jgi:hypothetical protein